MKTNPKIHLIERGCKLGLSSAYCTGFKWALNEKFDYVVQMDADLSHNPKDISEFISNAHNFELVIGSRYKTGVNVVIGPYVD